MAEAKLRQVEDALAPYAERDVRQLPTLRRQRERLETRLAKLTEDPRPVEPGTFRADEKVPLAVIDKREMQYLYREGSSYVFMDSDSYEQLPVDAGELGQAVRYLKEGDTAVLPTYQDRVIGIELPAAVELTVTETEPGVQGDRVSGARKPATLETGLVVQVPLFVEPGGRIKVDTRTGEYLARA